MSESQQIQPQENVENAGQQNQSVAETVVTQENTQPVVQALAQEGQVKLQEEQQKVEVQPEVKQQVVVTEQKVEERPTSPVRTREENGQSLLGSRSGGAKKRSQSPQVYKGKLDTVRKLLTKEQDKCQQIANRANQLKDKKKELQQTLKAKQEAHSANQSQSVETEKIAQELAALTATQQQIANELAELKTKRSQQLAEKDQEIENIKAANAALEQQLDAKRNSQILKKQEFEKNQLQVEARTKAESAKLASIQSQVQAKLLIKQTLQNRLADLNNHKTKAQQNLQNQNKTKEQAARKQNEVKQQLLKRIAEAKERINNKKQELANIQAQPVDDSKATLEKTTGEIAQLKESNNELSLSNKKLEQEINRKNKEAADLKQADKKKEKRISELKNKSDDYVKKITELKEEASKLEALKEEKKVVKYEEKVPEELLAIQAKNQSIRKQIKKTIEKYESQKFEMQKLVPPSTIQNMNKRISTIISNNERLTEVMKIIQEVSKENKKLDEEKDKLEWGENTYLKELEQERKNQEEKNKVIEEYLFTKKKTLQQLNAKLQEYVQAYPNFKPEKKKKAEPVVPQEVKGKKGQDKSKKATSSINEKSKSPAEDGKKKNKNIVEPNIERTASSAVEEVKVEQKAGKKKKKGVQSQIKEQTKSQIKQEPVKQEKQVVLEVKPEPKVQKPKPAEKQEGEAPKKKKNKK